MRTCSLVVEAIAVAESSAAVVFGRWQVVEVLLAETSAHVGEAVRLAERVHLLGLRAVDGGERGDRLARVENL